jgi:hypothetical protein
MISLLVGPVSLDYVRVRCSHKQLVYSDDSRVAVGRNVPESCVRQFVETSGKDTFTAWACLWGWLKKKDRVSILNACRPREKASHASLIVLRSMSSAAAQPRDQTTKDLSRCDA